VSSVKKILIGPSSFAQKDNSPIEVLEKENYVVVNNPFGRKLTKDELLELLDSEVVGLIAGLETLDRVVLSQSNLKCISRVGAGMSNIDLDAAKELGIVVLNTPDAPTQSVAELTIGALLNLLRMIPQMNSDLHDGKWNKKIGFKLEGKICLIIGYGRIGQRVARILKAFGAEIIIFDPFMQNDNLIKKIDNLEEALGLADIISLHNSGDQCILGSNEFSKLKSNVILLNASRGNAIHEPSLISALDNNKILGAWLDTFSEEPYKGLLINYSNVLLTPHVGSYTLECRKSMEMEAVNNLLSNIN